MSPQEIDLPEEMRHLLELFWAEGEEEGVNDNREGV